MWEFVRQNLNDIGIGLTALAFLLSICTLAFSASRYVSVRRDELKNVRYQKYHELLLKISRGSDIQGPLKLVSQRAFIYELRHFPEYSALSRRLLESLSQDWKEDPDKSHKLQHEIEDTLTVLNKS